jgi:LysR family positive regulator for ilvC
MNHRALHVFLTLSQTLHFRKTSELCHMTSSALSRMIQRLEEEVGSALFERSHRDVVLTEAGHEFIQFAHHVLAEWAALQARIGGEQAGVMMKGEVKLFSTVTAAYGVLPAIIKTFRSAHPGVMTYLETGISRQGFKLLTEGAVDFTTGIVTEQAKRQFAYHPVLETPLIGIIPSGGELDLFAWPLILPESGDVGDLVHQWLRQQCASPLIHSYVEGHEAILAMVAAGLGSAVLPRIVLENSHLQDHVQEVSSPMPLASLTVGIFMKETSYMATGKQAFWSFITRDIN